MFGGKAKLDIIYISQPRDIPEHGNKNSEKNLFVKLFDRKFVFSVFLNFFFL